MCKVPCGVPLSEVVSHFKHATVIRHRVVLIQNVAIGNVEPAVFMGMLRPLSMTHHLRDLSLMNCQLEERHAGILANWFDSKSADVRLASLSLSENPLGTEGLRRLAAAQAVFDVGTLHLERVGLQEASLLVLAHAIQTHAEGRGEPLALRKLNLARNDLSATSVWPTEHVPMVEEDPLQSIAEDDVDTGPDAVAGKATTGYVENEAVAALVKALAHTRVANWVLDKTRLDATQVATLCRGVSQLMPQLTTLELVGVSMSPPLARNALLGLLHTVSLSSGTAASVKGSWTGKSTRGGMLHPPKDDSARWREFALKRVGINKFDYPELFSEVQRMLHLHSSAARSPQHVHAKESGIRLRMHPGRHVMRLGPEQALRSDGYTCPLVILYTPFGSIVARDTEKRAAYCAAEDAVECMLRYDSPHRSIDLYALRRCPDRAMPPCLKSVVLLMYRPGTRTLLMRAMPSPAADALRRRMKTNVLGEEFVLADRYPSANLKQRHRFSLEELLDNLDLQRFPDDELHNLASLDDVACFAAFFRNTVRQTEHSRSRATRAMSVPVMRELQAKCREELARRDVRELARAATQFEFFTFHVGPDIDLGDRFSEVVFATPAKAATEEDYLGAAATLVVGAHAVPLVQSMLGKQYEPDGVNACDTNDDRGVWKLRLLLVTVPEHVMEPDTNLPFGWFLKAAGERSPPLWVALDDAEKRKEKEESSSVWARTECGLSSHLQAYIDQGFVDIEADIRALVEASNGSDGLRLERASLAERLQKESAARGRSAEMPSHASKQVVRQGDNQQTRPAADGTTWRREGSHGDGSDYSNGRRRDQAAWPDGRRQANASEPQRNVEQTEADGGSRHRQWEAPQDDHWQTDRRCRQAPERRLEGSHVEGGRWRQQAAEGAAKTSTAWRGGRRLQERRGEHEGVVDRDWNALRPRGSR
eukprot:NODE_114_length_3622_cov_2.812589.p1 GENE.NODE_114_length_3622_cov_2.812589~~NODE_114_length_3622_cov_2.812589.p1  ORF type:complete len:934 (+),score=168.12 NODE_114_length_3622_cov_2.812589:2-2803(+)